MLRKVPLKPTNVQPSATFDMPLTPYNKGGTGKFAFKTEALNTFMAWLCNTFHADTRYGEFQLAVAMDCHRIIADEWLCALTARGLIQSDVIKQPITEFQCLVFIIPKAVHKEHKRPVEVSFEEHRAYDPWTDREHDALFPEALWPELYVDKYYMAWQSEYYLVMRRPRIRPNKHMFIPLNVPHPERYQQRIAPPSLEVRAEYDALMNGDKTMQKPS